MLKVIFISIAIAMDNSQETYGDCKPLRTTSGIVRDQQGPICYAHALSTVLNAHLNEKKYDHFTILKAIMCCFTQVVPFEEFMSLNKEGLSFEQALDAMLIPQDLQIIGKSPSTTWNEKFQKIPRCQEYINLVQEIYENFEIKRIGLLDTKAFGSDILQSVDELKSYIPFYMSFSVPTSFSKFPLSYYENFLKFRHFDYQLNNAIVNHNTYKHAVTVVNIVKKDNGVQITYKNSWGQKWGYKGYARLTLGIDMADTHGMTALLLKKNHGPTEEVETLPDTFYKMAEWYQSILNTYCFDLNSFDVSIDLDKCADEALHKMMTEGVNVEYRGSSRSQSKNLKYHLRV